MDEGPKLVILLIIFVPSLILAIPFAYSQAMDEGLDALRAMLIAVRHPGHQYI